MCVRSKVRGQEVAVFLLEDSRVRFTFILFFLGDLSPDVRESKTFLNSGFHVTDSLSVELGFRIPIVSGIPDSLSCIPDSKAQDSGFHSKFFRDSEFHKKKFRGLRGIQIPLHWATFLENNRNILVIKCEKYQLEKS